MEGQGKEATESNDSQCSALWTRVKRNQRERGCGKKGGNGEKELEENNKGGRKRKRKREKGRKE